MPLLEVNSSLGDPLWAFTGDGLAVTPDFFLNQVCCQVTFEPFVPSPNELRTVYHLKCGEASTSHTFEASKVFVRPRKSLEFGRRGS